MALTVPPYLVAPLRSIFGSQGLSPTMIADDGTIDPLGFLPLAYDRGEFRSLFGVMPFETRVVAGPPDPLMAVLRPALILEGRAGQLVIAPFGLPEPSVLSWFVPLAGVSVLVFVGYLIGRARR